MDRDKVILAIIGLITFSIYKILNKDDDESGRPPLVKYRIPWLGSAIELGKDPDAVFQKAMQAFGPVFRIKAAGQEYTYITSPDTISAVYRDAKTFEYSPIRYEMAEVIMGMPKHLSDPIHLGPLFKFQYDNLSPQNVHKLHERFGMFAYECIQKTLDDFCGDNKITKLLSVTRSPAYDAMQYTFFGKTYPTRESYELFRTFDQGFLMLQTSIPRFLLRKYINARERLIKLTEGYIAKPHDDCSEFIQEVERLANEAKWSSRDIANFFTGDIWAFQSNTMQGVYWIIALQLQKPEGLTKIIEEIDAERDTWIRNNPRIQDETRCRWILEGSFPLLTSTIQESLRYASASFSIRIVRKETTLGGYRIREGDYVICNTRCVHMDDEIHKNPTEFIPERYLGTAKFMKNGRIVPNHTMPFGGGVSMCEGRHFATGELKIFIALFLSLVGVELADPSCSERPQLDWGHLGTGLLPPKGDLSVRITRRATY
ncbi:hypothetical protein Clacol_002133 [Clathrus columnatus]|uniref:Cytochrome P450 n=1 Tax=Clathrus columnatus TaxID=1419009 RepID=A0AAV5A5R6_9AGAM|nr:hypothetical protein Clacol_002133 [Clathrus columnatus]